jgi:endonuclease-3 related protein
MLGRLYGVLLERYGPQGWWPLVSLEGGNPTKTGSLKGYHPGDYSYPRTESQRFEVCVGAVLTQNTAWVNVEKALVALWERGLLDAHALLDADLEDVKAAVRPAGYYNQKASRLRLVASWFIGRTGVPSRAELLGLKGVGPETADSMLLYAFKQPFFVVDAYTRRVLVGLGLVDGSESYDEVQALFHDALESDVEVFQEYHALLVEHAKRHYSKKPYGQDDFLGVSL